MARTRLHRLGMAATALTATAGLLVVAEPASAVPGRVVISATSATDSVAQKWASAKCPVGTVILGGGGSISGGGNHVRINQDGPQKNGWPVAASEDTFGYAGDWSVTSWAICGTSPAGYQIVAIDITVNTWGTVIAACPAGKQVIGFGGLVWATSIPNGVLDTVRVNNLMTQVIVTAYHDETMPLPGTTLLIAAIAICANPLPGQVLVTIGTAGSSQDKDTAATCPSGTQVHGLGAALYGASGEVNLVNILPTTKGARFNAREDSTGFAGQWSLEGYAICAH